MEIAMDTYHSQAEADADRTRLSALLAALDASPSTLRLDACRLWTLRGRHGYASTWGDGDTYLLMVGCRSSQARTWSKKRLLGWPGLAVLMQDGDNEGTFRLLRLPVPGEAEEIRSLVGLRKRTAWADPEAARAADTGSLIGEPARPARGCSAKFPARRVRSGVREQRALSVRFLRPYRPFLNEAGHDRGQPPRRAMAARPPQ
jgi:hypothetical protein